MKKTQFARKILFLMLVSSLALAACSSKTPAMAAEPTVKVANDATLGDFLVDGNGMTLYMYVPDKPDESTCTGACLEAWPPLVTEGSPVAGSGVNASLLGAGSMPDGRKIVTYNHMPLYFFAKDSKAGDVAGQGVGGIWYVVGPDGNPIGYSMGQ
jgi:predicted lipoprotein with Yx(FWY)xxD motif